MHRPTNRDSRHDKAAPLREVYLLPTVFHPRSKKGEKSKQSRFDFKRRYRQNRRGK